MENHGTTERKGTDSIDQRDVRALEQYLTVLPEASDLYTVVSESGKAYTLDARDGDTSRRSILGAIGALLAAGAVPTTVTVDADDEGEADDSTALSDQPKADRKLIRSRPDQTVAHTVADIPRETWEHAQERAERWHEPGRTTAFLFDYVDLEFAFTVDGEQVHATEGFDPSKVVAPAGRNERVVDLADVHGEADPEVDDGDE